MNLLHLQNIIHVNFKKIPLNILNESNITLIY